MQVKVKITAAARAAVQGWLRSNMGDPGPAGLLINKNYVLFSIFQFRLKL